SLIRFIVDRFYLSFLRFCLSLGRFCLSLSSIKDLPGLEPDPFEGSQWDGLGFFVQYLWAFGIVFALISSGIAAGTYNEGATDFKETPVYKEAMESRDLLDEAEVEGLNSEDVFESNPTEVAPTIFEVDHELLVFVILQNQSEKPLFYRLIVAKPWLAES
ncbi:PREDICTED: uncharacterized protein LOC106302545, partial [Brassica oleracea var. oleracea]|uniref:uncharacterized protein LOC106302545 n=1 Tax=Brassica oleracea var. oleracea TaxID=109376 RepID=UPI0006A74305